MSYTSASDVKLAEVGEYLTNNVSRSIVYALMLSQPLTREELEKSPVRSSIRSVPYRQGEEERKEARLRTILSKGVGCGILISYKSGGRNYYFLNSDLLLSPRAIKDPISDEKTNQMDIDIVEGVGEILGDAALPPDSKAAGGNSMPIPNIDSEKRLLLWLSWLTTPKRREILGLIASKKSVPRPELRKQLGFWADRLVMNEGIPVGIISMEGKALSFQFSSLEAVDLGKDQQGIDSAVRWIEKPPRFMLTRSYEILRCIHGSGAIIDELKKSRKSPMNALEELESAGRKIIKKNRKKFLSTNFFEFASLYGTIDGLPKSQIQNDSIPLLMPDEISLNEFPSPIIWIKETTKPVKISRTQFAADANRILSTKKTETERIAELERLMRRIAKERIHQHLEKIERQISGQMANRESQSFSLGKEALSRFASLEMEREELLNEKKYAEKFFDLIFGSEEKQ